MKTRKFKLIKEYPGSPLLESIEEFYVIPPFKNIKSNSDIESMHYCSAYPEYWEEVIDPLPKWIWFWGSDIHDIRNIKESIGFNDFQEMKKYSLNHSKKYLYDYPWAVNNYWNSYIDTEKNYLSEE